MRNSLFYQTWLMSSKSSIVIDLFDMWWLNVNWWMRRGGLEAKNISLYNSQMCGVSLEERFMSMINPCHVIFYFFRLPFCVIVDGRFLVKRSKGFKESLRKCYFWLYLLGSKIGLASMNLFDFLNGPSMRLKSSQF